jgi:hypothetical protein
MWQTAQLLFVTPSLHKHRAAAQRYWKMFDYGKPISGHSQVVSAWFSRLIVISQPRVHGCLFHGRMDTTTELKPRINTLRIHVYPAAGAGIG